MTRVLLLLMACSCLAEPVVLNWREAAMEPIHPIISRSGESIFLRELYTLRRPEDFRIAAFLGFNAVIEQGPEVFTQAAEVDFWVTEASWYAEGFQASAAIEEAGIGLRQPALISYNLNDEPDLRTHIHGPAVLGRAAALLREHDPAARTSVTLAGWGPARAHWPAFAETVDILRVDPYPLIANKPLAHVRELVEAAREVAPGKPVVSILQAWSWPGGPWPDADQTRHMVYQSLIAGANGISFFDWNDAHWSAQPDFWKELFLINQELQELEPFLLSGTRYQPLLVDGVYAGLWMRGGRWILLAVQLEPSGAERQMEIHIPGLGKSFVAPLPASGTQLITSSSVIVEPRLTAGDWATDWAGRPLHPAPAQPDSLFRGPPSPISLRISGPFPGEEALDEAGQVFRVCPGGIFRHELVTTGAEQIRLVSWHDTREGHTDLSDWVTLQPKSTPGQRDGDLQRRWELQVHLPVDTDWPTNRDHLLTLALDHANGSLERVIRFRLEPGFAFSWEWQDDWQGEVAVSPRFPAEHYQIDQAAWHLSVSSNAIQAETISAGPLTATVRLSPTASEDGLYTVTAELSTKEQLLASGGVTRLWLENGQLHRPETPKKAIAKPLAEGLNEQADFTALWEATEDLDGCGRFVAMGSPSFTDERHRAWFAYSQTHLYWFMESPVFGSDFRAETTEPDRRFLGDSLMVLLLQVPESDRTYLLQMNPAGIPSHRQVAPPAQPEWDPALQIRTAHDDQAWRLICAIPWSELGLAGTPTELAINIGTARSIAPRIRTTWHYWGRPFNPAESLAPLTFQGLASPDP